MSSWGEGFLLSSVNSCLIYARCGVCYSWLNLHLLLPNYFIHACFSIILLKSVDREGGPAEKGGGMSETPREMSRGNVLRTCCISDVPFQREKGNFDPTAPKFCNRSFWHSKVKKHIQDTSPHAKFGKEGTFGATFLFFCILRIASWSHCAFYCDQWGLLTIKNKV